ncbi:hypothetical protein [Sporomusa sphaeroides]|uniref:Uncharacterized protein n=1 Tax=Sporomusa sphaeroides DSM 2875 TaxID=1337886 RepID=A0A1U7M9X6_9FIRM|nr:hypothetical protein [Sporomusa sphaeroides]OLS54322.1 hypothetical protein SPSPH_45680 [Sporomusa sphaeroides DSM 2875]CVK21551.1 hypothetical protein SSPH_04243 [Sporomusa sphaeroides DSM 2875]
MKCFVCKNRRDKTVEMNKIEDFVTVSLTGKIGKEKKVRLVKYQCPECGAKRGDMLPVAECQG